MSKEGRLRTLGWAILLFISSGTLMAHHGTNISYDTSKTIVLEGVVTEFAFSNPHCQIYFDVQDGNGQIVEWAAEGATPRNWTARGWGGRDTLKPGDRIRIAVNPSRAGTPVGNIRGLVLPDGRVLGEMDPD